MKKSTLAILALSTAIMSACSTSPTGRSQVLMYSESEMAQMGQTSFSALKERDAKTISQDKDIIDYVSCISDAIIAQLPDSQRTGWEVVVFDSEQVNAFALPGKKIGVYTGMVDLAANQHQLAAVMGHEVGHVLAQHSNERLSHQTLVNAGMQITAAALGDADPTTKQAVATSLGLGAQIGIMLPYSREHETEADGIGLKLMAQAGFEPKESVNLWRRMGEASESEPLEIMSSHPSNASRISGLESKMFEAQGFYNRARAQGLSPKCFKPKK